MNRHLHIYRNTPYGRDTLLHSIYFCRNLELDLQIYIPETKKFLMYFENEAVEVTLDPSYVKYSATARDNAEKLLAQQKFAATFFEPEQFTGANLPDIPTDAASMTCPRIISDLSSKISLGKIGSKVRTILRYAPFPVLIPCQVFKEWSSVTVMFGGSPNSINALQLGIKIALTNGMPLDVVTQAEEGKPKESYETILHERNLMVDLDKTLRHWHFFEEGAFDENLFFIPSDTLIVMGTSGHGRLKSLVLGSTTEMIQSLLPNSLLLVGTELKKDLYL